jgi:hypothetical protein
MKSATNATLHCGKEEARFFRSVHLFRSSSSSSNGQGLRLLVDPFWPQPSKSLKMTVLWDVAPCSLVEVYRRFRCVFCLHQGDDTLKMEAARTSETSVDFYQTIPLNIPEYSHLPIRRR